METNYQEHNKDGSNNDPNQQAPICLDLMPQILSRLPVKSLLKFQYVSKTWYSIIRSKNFINSSIYKPSPQLLIYFNNTKLTNEGTEKTLYFFSSLDKVLDMKMTSIEDYYYARCNSINGFMCLSHKGRFMIYNHNTKQVITLPEIEGNKYLGYDPVNDEYKAICRRVSKNKDGTEEHMVLTLGGDKPLSWRHIKGVDRHYSPFTKGICINGSVYYGAWTITVDDLHDLKKFIVRFDVRSETLSHVELPSMIDVDWGATSTLINYKGKLANINFITSGPSLFFVFDLWVLQDAKKHKWLKHKCCISKFDWYSTGEVHASFYSTNKNGEIIIAPKYLPPGVQPFYILYYNVEKNQIRRFDIEGIAGDGDFKRFKGIGNDDNCQFFIVPDHCTNFTFF